MKAGTTKEQARMELRDIETKIQRRIFIHEKKCPLFSDVKKEWLEHKRQFLRETTWENCERNIRNHFVSLDRLNINQITTATVERWISELRNVSVSTARTRKPAYIPEPDDKKLSINTMRKIIINLNQIMGYAVRHRYIDYNPVRDAEKPRNQGKEEQQQRKISILSPEQIRAFLEAVTELKYRTLFLTAIMTGARQGEILGLKWSDVDFSKKQLNINRTFNMQRFFTPKTKYSIRKIDLSPMVIKALAEWKLKSGGNDESLIFPNESGEPMNYSNMMNRYFKKALIKAGISKIRFHDLRHTYASLMIQQGENIKYIQTQLGHSSPTVTLNVYAHLMKEQNQEAVCRLENTIFEATGHNLVTKRKKGLTACG
jgi:integrase